jgi:ferrous iron transport protein A
MFGNTKNPAMIRLSELPTGHKAVIREFEQPALPEEIISDRSGDDIHVKLMEMGCVPGETVSITKIAPLGDPISIAVAGYNLSLRRTEAQYIWVEEVVEKVRLSY